MSKKNQSAQTTETFCPACGAKLALSAAGAIKPKRRGWFEALIGDGGSDNYQATARQYYPSEATVAQPWTQPKQPETGGPLAPGEIVWRRLDTDDVRVALLLGAVGVAPLVLGGLAVVGTIALDTAWLWWIASPLTVFLLASDGVYWLMVWPHIRHDETQLRIRERPIEEQPQTIAQQPIWRVQAAVEERGGHHTVFDDFEIGDPGAWCEFCRLVDANRCNFSAASAEKFGIDVTAFNGIRDRWAERGLVDPNTVGKGKTPVLTRAGKALVRTFANTPPPAT